MIKTDGLKCVHQIGVIVLFTLAGNQSKEQKTNSIFEKDKYEDKIFVV